MRLVNPLKGRRPGAAQRRRWGVLACAMAAGLLTALIGFPGTESELRQLKNAIHAHRASGEVAVVGIDDRSLAALGRWPIPRRVYARLIDRLFESGAKTVTFDIDLSQASTPIEDNALAAAIARHPGKVTLADRVMADPVTGAIRSIKPLSMFVKRSRVANLTFWMDAEAAVTRLPYAYRVGDDADVGLAASVAGRAGKPFSPMIQSAFWQSLIERGFPDQSTFPLDGSIDPRSIPLFSADDILVGHASKLSLEGDRVLVGPYSEQLGDMYFAQPFGRVPGVMLQAIGADTLIAGRPVIFGFIPALLIAVALTSFATTVLGKRAMVASAIAGVTLLPLISAILPRDWLFDVVPGMLALGTAAGLGVVGLVRETIRNRATINQVSGLLNLTALRLLPAHQGTRLVVAHIHNFAEATATMPVAGEATLIAQIAARLRLGMTEKELYHGDNGVFAWFSRDDVDTVGERLDALHALFRSGVTIDERVLDLVVTFGVDDDASRSIANRLGSALVAATEAHADGARWREFDRSKLADTAWKLSMLSELDAAIDDGALWVAYQPKLDLRERRIVGAEALVRWTHPEKGAISPIEFVAAAEQHNRIEKLTMHVLERAVLAAATINAHEIGFGIAVNLSARLLDGAGLVDQVSAVLARHALDPSRLTLEVTETATLASGRSLDALHALRALGVHISIDDYGTGLSTLEYLRKIPAGEIKIDRSFVQAVLSSSSDLLMVNSTIQLAHSLGHIVVAEGIESADVLMRLSELGCDVAQGYHIGRPMTFQDLARRLLAERRQAA